MIRVACLVRQRGIGYRLSVVGCQRRIALRPSEPTTENRQQDYKRWLRTGTASVSLLPFRMRLRLGQQGPHFEDRDHRQEPHEEEEECEEETDRADEEAPVPERAGVHAP